MSFHQKPSWFRQKCRIRSTDDGNPVKLERPVHGAENRELDPAQVTHKPGVQVNIQEVYDGKDCGFLLPGRIEVFHDDRV